jgi:hypothetical protein
MARSRRIKVAELENQAKAIGYVCIMWGHLEGFVDMALQELAPLPRDQTSNCITVNADIRSKIEMIKGIAFIRKGSDAWFDEMLILLNRIDNELRPKRNRYIHDLWLGATGNSTEKMTRRTVLSRPQAFQRNLSTFQMSLAGKNEVWDFVKEIVMATFALNLLIGHHIRLTSEGSKPKRPQGSAEQSPRSDKRGARRT